MLGFLIWIYLVIGIVICRRVLEKLGLKYYLVAIVIWPYFIRSIVGRHQRKRRITG